MKGCSKGVTLNHHRVDCVLRPSQGPQRAASMNSASPEHDALQSFLVYSSLHANYQLMLAPELSSLGNWGWRLGWKREREKRGGGRGKEEEEEERERERERERR